MTPDIPSVIETNRAVARKAGFDGHEILATICSDGLTMIGATTATEPDDDEEDTALFELELGGDG